MPSVQRVYEAFKNADVRVLTISIDVEGSKIVRPFLMDNGYTMPALLDSNMDLFSKLGLRGTPGTFIVDRQAMIVARGFGPVDFDNAEFRRYIRMLAI